MTGLVLHPLRDVVEYLESLCAGLELDHVHWVHGGYEADNWCYSCCKAKVRHLRRHEKDKQKRREYRVDGGWGSEEDGVAVCTGCGRILAYSLTCYGVADELDHFLSNGPFDQDGKIGPETAYILERIFDGAQYTEDPHVKNDLNQLADLIRKGMAT